MPPADRATDFNLRLLRTLLYGPSKARKTWWALLCAKAGYNVILLDGDDGSHILSQIDLTPQERARIQVVDCVNSNDDPTFARFMARLLKKNNKFNWDEQGKREIAGLWDANHSHYVVDARKLTRNDVLIADSWTALADSTNFQYAEENNIDLSDATKTEWPGYMFNATFLNWVLSRLHTLTCHVIVIAHSQVYETWDRTDKNPKNHKLLSRTIVPISSSGRHSSKLSKEFSDILYFDRLSDVATTINSGGDMNRDGGSRLIPPKTWRFEELSPEYLFNNLGSKPTGQPCEGFVWYDKGKNPYSGDGNVTEMPVPSPSSPSSGPVLQNAGTGGLALRLKLGGAK